MYMYIYIYIFTHSQKTLVLRVSGDHPSYWDPQEGTPTVGKAPYYYLALRISRFRLNFEGLELTGFRA